MLDVEFPKHGRLYIELVQGGANQLDARFMKASDPGKDDKLVFSVSIQDLIRSHIRASCVGPQLRLREHEVAEMRKVPHQLRESASHVAAALENIVIIDDDGRPIAE